MLNRRYKHFKGNVYEVLFIAKHSETLEEMIVYKRMNGERDCATTELDTEGGDGSIWVRPLEMWNQTVIKDGKEVKRFELIGEHT